MARSRPGWCRPWRCRARSRPRDGPRPEPPAAVPAIVLRAGHERIGAVVDVEQHALRAFEQDAAAARARFGQHLPHRLRELQHEIGDIAQVGDQAGAVDRRFAEAGAQRVVVRGEAVELRRRARRDGRGRRPGSRGARPCPHTPGRCRDAWCRSCPRPMRPHAARRGRGGTAGSARNCRRPAGSRG